MSMDRPPSRPENPQEFNESGYQPAEPKLLAELLQPAELEDYYRQTFTSPSRLERRTFTQVSRDLMLGAWAALEIRESESAFGPDSPEDVAIFMQAVAQEFKSSVNLHETKNVKDENYLKARLGQAWIFGHRARIEQRAPLDTFEQVVVSREMALLVDEVQRANADDLGPLAETLTIGLFSDPKAPYLIFPTSPREAGAQTEADAQFKAQHHDGYILTDNGKVTTEIKSFRGSVSGGGDHVLLRVGHKLNEVIQGRSIPTQEENQAEMSEALQRVATAFITEQLSPEELTQEDQQLLQRCRNVLSEKIEDTYRKKGGQLPLAEITLY